MDLFQAQPPQYDHDDTQEVVPVEPEPRDPLPASPSYVDVLVFLFRLSPKIMYTIKSQCLRWVEIHVVSVIGWALTVSNEHEL